MKKHLRTLREYQVYAELEVRKLSFCIICLALREKCPNSKYADISGLYFPVFSPNTEKYGPEITPYLDTFHAGCIFEKIMQLTMEMN